MVDAAGNPVLKELLNALADRVAMLDRWCSVLLPGRAECGPANHRLVIAGDEPGRRADEAEVGKAPQPARGARRAAALREAQFD